MSKESMYAELAMQAQALIEDEPDMIANMANLSSLIYWRLPDTNWVGFYLSKDEELVLGPFQGKPACVRIPLGRGVCGSAAKHNLVQRVADVHEFEGHIACDASSNSEIVIPIVKNEQVIGVLDLDSPKLDRFDETDQQGLIKLVEIFQASL